MNDLTTGSMLPPNPNPTSQSNSFLAGECGSVMVGLFTHKILFLEPIAVPINRAIFYVNDLEVLKY